MGRLFRAIPTLLLCCLPLACSDLSGTSTSSGGNSGGDVDWDGLTPQYGGDRSGVYEAEFITLSCSGDCSAQSILGPVSYCDVGDRSYESIPVAHGTEGQLVFDLRRGRMSGWLDGLGFSVEGTASEAGGEVTIDAVMKGAFEDVGTPGFAGELSYVASGSHDGNAIECTGVRSVVADWEEHGCDERPEVCPEALPLCHQDVCQAGGAGDPCDEDEHCGEGLMCGGDETCLVGATGDACSDDRDCISGLCPDGTCTEGALGDPCSNDNECAEGLLCGAAKMCSAGAVGDPCTSESDCAPDLLCGGDETCSKGDVGDPCTSESDCAPDLLCGGDETCSKGEVGDSCTFDGDCAQGFMCGGGDVCSAGNPGDPCDAFWDCLSETCKPDGTCG